MKLKLLFLTILNSVALIASPIRVNGDVFDIYTNKKGIAQSFDDSVKVRSIYNASRTLLTDLVHTKLEVSFDWSNAYLIGRETLTAKPHFYPSDSIILDAKGMEISQVSMNGVDLIYKYDDGLKLTVKLDREYTSSEQYTLNIEYIAKPNERETS